MWRLFAVVLGKERGEQTIRIKVRIRVLNNLQARKNASSTRTVRSAVSELQTLLRNALG